MENTGDRRRKGKRKWKKQGRYSINCMAALHLKVQFNIKANEEKTKIKIFVCYLWNRVESEIPVEMETFFPFPLTKNHFWPKKPVPERQQFFCMYRRISQLHQRWGVGSTSPPSFFFEATNMIKQLNKLKKKDYKSLLPKKGNGNGQPRRNPAFWCNNMALERWKTNWFLICLQVELTLNQHWNKVGGKGVNVLFCLCNWKKMSSWWWHMTIGSFFVEESNMTESHPPEISMSNFSF